MHKIETDSARPLMSDKEKLEECIHLLGKALRAIVFTRDYVGEDKLPAIDGYEWYDAGQKIAHFIMNTSERVWAEEFFKRVNLYESVAVREVFKPGDWIFGLGEHKGCSEVFMGYLWDYQPFSFLNDFDPRNFRLATADEVNKAKEIIQ
jgi:hypothetical protein